MLGGPGRHAAAGSAANCAALGVPAGFQQANSQISVTTGGNRELDPERSRSFSAGFVWSPWFGNNASWSERFDVEVTFYRHAIDGAIQAINAQTQLDLCVALTRSTVMALPVQAPVRSAASTTA